MIWLAWALVVCGGLAATTYLVVTGHPSFALLVLAVIFCSNVTTDKDDVE